MVARPEQWYFVTIALGGKPLGGVFAQASSAENAMSKMKGKYVQGGKYSMFFSFIVSEFPIPPGVRYRGCMLTTTELDDLVKVREGNNEQYLRIISGKEDRRKPGWYNVMIQDQSNEVEPYLGCCFVYAESHHEAREKCRQSYPFPEPAFCLASWGEPIIHAVYRDRLIEKAEYERMNNFCATHGMKAFNHLLETGATV